jgi:hypothetical protein
MWSSLMAMQPQPRAAAAGDQGPIQSEVSSKSAMAQPAAVAVMNIFNLCGSK